MIQRRKPPQPNLLRETQAQMIERLRGESYLTGPPSHSIPHRGPNSVRPARLITKKSFAAARSGAFGFIIAAVGKSFGEKK
jgi:hypothetical protein